MDKILVLDFGGQYNQLIARRIRSEQVYAEIKPYNKITPEEIKETGYKGIIFTGGPNSVYEEASPHYDPAILDLGIPILGICYGDQLMAYMAGGEIASAENSSEYGKTTVFTADNVLFEGLPSENICWMSHTDYVKTPPKGFTTIAHTDKCPCAAMCDESRKLYGVQFHPEVTHTAYGKQMFHNFIFAVCGCKADWKMENFVEIAVEKHKRKLAGKKVLLAAADTFRAAAIEQLEVWANRAQVDIIKQNEGSDPAAVVFDAISSAKHNGTEVLVIDTAGRLHNKKNLMDELNKINRVIDRELPGCSREVLLVLDATTGQNAINQAKEFKNAANITGIVLTKLDGTAKGGIVFSVKKELGIPVKYIGVGEKMEDLQPFNAEEFVKALFDDEQ